MKKLVIVIFLAIIILFGYFLLSQPVEAPIKTQHDEEVQVLEEKTAQNSALETETTPSSTEQAEKITINTESLSDSQKKALETVGIEGDIEITPEMQSCAEAKVGKERLDEIIAGDSPTFIEGIQLVSCY